MQFIMFLSRFLTSTKTRYWSTGFEMTKFVWMLRKICHLIEFLKHSTIVYTNHDAILNIAKQTTLSISFTNKRNLWFDCVSDYLQCFYLIIKSKLNKFHVISNTLLNFFAFFDISTNFKFANDELNALVLNVLFITLLTKINKSFKYRIIEKYIKNSNWQKIIKIIDVVEKNHTKIFFLRDQSFILKKWKNNNISFISRRMCISITVIQDILEMIYDNEH